MWRGRNCYRGALTIHLGNYGRQLPSGRCGNSSRVSRPCVISTSDTHRSYRYRYVDIDSSIKGNINGISSHATAAGFQLKKASRALTGRAGVPPPPPPAAAASLRLVAPRAPARRCARGRPRADEWLRAISLSRPF